MRAQLALRNLSVYQIVIILTVGLLLGASALFLDPYIFFALFVGIIYILVVIKVPELAILGILFFTSSIIDTNSFRTFPIGIGNLSVVDFLVIIPVLVILVKALVDPNFKFVKTPLNIPFLGFYVVALLSTFIGIRQGTVLFNAALDEIRIVNLYLVFFMTINLVRDEKRLRRLLKGFIFLSFAISVAMAIQYILGDKVPILPGRVEELILTGENTSTIRVLPPGQSIVMLGFVTLLIQLIIDKNTRITFIKLVQILVIVFAVLLTFNRSFWVSIGIALVLVFLLIQLPNRVRFISIVLGTILIAAILIPTFSALSPQFNAFVDSSYVRMQTIINPDTVNEPSLQYRVEENAYALPQIAAHPLIGMGLGAKYRPLDRRLDFPTQLDGRMYIHNGHYWLLLKTGFIGYSLFMLSVAIFLARSFQTWRKIPDPFMRGFILAFAATMCGLLITAFVNPYFRNTYWAPVFGIMFATVEVALNNKKDQPQVLVSQELQVGKSS
ncbi:MAG: O-antigen ligase family protein [Anaerolineaceae bacterium]|nr:O-antigen ligase family protein [Anaerolineaceae bacterium]